MKVLHEGLVKNETLEYLSLCKCNITNAGAEELAKLLRSNSKLQSLWVLGNREIGDAGARSLAAALSEGSDVNATLDRIYMGGNSISSECEAECVRKTNGRIVFLPDEFIDM